MNYLTISRDLGCATISDVRITVGGRYVLSTSVAEHAQGAEELLSDLLLNMRRVNDKVTLEDHATGRVMTERIEALGEYASQHSAAAMGAERSELQIDFIPLTFKEQLWRHLVARYEYLRADIDGNFGKYKDFVAWLMELMCEQYEAQFLQEADDDDRHMEFTHFVDHTIDALDGVVRRKSDIGDDFFQKRYYLLKEELAVQERNLSALLRLPEESNLVDICERLGEQQSGMSHSISNIIRDIDGLRGAVDSQRIAQALDTTRSTLSAILEDLGTPVKPKPRERKDVVDGYFLPFHRVRTRTNMRDSRGSRRSVSLHNSKNMVSERVSYDSYSRNMLASRMNLGSGLHTQRSDQLRKNYSDHSMKRKCTLEDANDNVYSVDESSPADMGELARCRAILGEIGFGEAEMADPALAAERLQHFDRLDAHNRQLEGHIQDLRDELEQKQDKAQLLASKCKKLLNALQKSVAPQLNGYKAELEELSVVINEGYISSLLDTYKQLKDRKLEINDERVEFLKKKCEQFIIELEHTSKATKTLNQSHDFSAAIQKVTKIMNSRMFRVYAQKLEQAHTRLYAASQQLSKESSCIADKLHTLTAKNEWLAGELQTAKRAQNKINEEHEVYVTSLRSHYEDIASSAKKDIEASASAINELKNAVREQKQNNERLEEELSISEKKVRELQENLEKVSEEKMQTSELGAIDDELEKLNIMNSKLVGEIEIMTKRSGQQRTEIDTLNQRLYETEDLSEKVKELTLSNKLMREKLEVFESCKMVAGERNRKSDGSEIDVGLLSNGDLLDGSVKNSNKTIYEVEEGLERSDIENSMEAGRSKSHTVGQIARGRASSLYKTRENRKPDYLLTTINTNYSYTRNKDDERESASPGSNSKKNIFSANSIIKNISALKRSDKSPKVDDSRDLRPTVQEFFPVDTRKLNRLNALMTRVGRIYDRVDVGECVDRVVALEEKIKQLQSMLADQDIENLARPKRDSNLQPLTERSLSSRNQSHYIDNEDLGDDDSQHKPASPLKTQNQKFKAGDKISKASSKSNNIKKSGRLEKINKPMTTASPSRKPQSRTANTQPKTSKLQNAPTKKDMKRSGADIDVAEEDTRAQLEELRNKHSKLQAEVESLKNKSHREEDVLRKAFDIALPLIEEQLEDTSDLDYMYLDQIVDVLRNKVMRYEDALDSLQQEVENLRQGYPEHSDAEPAKSERLHEQPQHENSLVEEDLEGEQQDTAEQNGEQLNDMKKAFDELICEMFTLAADNIDNVAALEAYVGEEHDQQSDTLQANAREDIAGELDKIKGYMLRLREMIEVLYENLMTYMNDVQAGKLGGTVQADEVSIANLQAENEYLCKRLETFNENYQDLNKKYLALLGEKNAALGKSTSTPQLEFGEEAIGDDTLKDKMRKFLQSNIDFVPSGNEQQHAIEEPAPGQGGSSTADEQVYQLTYLLRRINQIIKSENTDNYKIMKVEDILENPEAQ